jgi:hypothetical protein
MFAKKFNSKITALILSALALSTCSEAFATPDRSRSHDARVVAAQANYQDENFLNPIVDTPIPFSVQNFKTNFGVSHDKSVFEVKVPGLYSIDSFLLVNVPNIGDIVEGYITINGRKLLTFYSREVRTGSPVVDFHFDDRLVYLKKGDKVSVVLSNFAPGTTVLARGFVIVALNNSR